MFGYDYIYCWMPWSYWNGLVKSLSATGHKFPVQTQLKDAEKDKNNCVDWEFEYCRYPVSFEVNYNVKKNSQTLHKRKMSSRCPYKRLIAWTPRQKEAQPPPSRRRVLIRAVGGAVLTALTQMSRWFICVSGEPLELHATCKELFKGRFSHRTESCSLGAAAVWRWRPPDASTPLRTAQHVDGLCEVSSLSEMLHVVFMKIWQDRRYYNILWGGGGPHEQWLRQ